MRLSQWQSRSPNRESLAAKVLPLATEALALLGAEHDPDCWVSWGDDPGTRFSILAPAPAGLAVVNVRVNVPGEGPRVAGKLARWNRVSVGELSVELQGGHRLITFQVESQLLRGSDDDADEVARFVAVILAGIDGRAVPRAPAIALPGPGASGTPDAVRSRP